MAAVCTPSLPGNTGQAELRMETKRRIPPSQNASTASQREISRVGEGCKNGRRAFLEAPFAYASLFHVALPDLYVRIII